MKSRLFRNSQASAESFKLEAMKHDLAAMLGIGTDKLPAFVKAVGAILSTGKPGHDRIAEAALPQVGVDRATFGHACNAAGWLATEFYPKGGAADDTPENLADDMIELGMIRADQRSACSAFLSAIKYAVQVELQAEVEKDRALQRGAPKVMGVETALFFRNVFRKKPAK